MTTFTKVLLTESVDGRGILVADTATPGTLIHFPGTGTAARDEIWLYAVNTAGSDKKLTVEFGGVGAPDDNIELTLAAESGLYLVIPGLVLQNCAPVRAFCETADVAVIHGFVNRITA